MTMTSNDIRNKLDELLTSFDPQLYIADNPIQVVHEMIERNGSVADIELCAIWTAMLSWKNKESATRAARHLMEACDWKIGDLVKYGDFYDLPDDLHLYQTLKGAEFKAACHNLRQFYGQGNTVADKLQSKSCNVEELLNQLAIWLAPVRPGTPSRNSSCSRLCTLLRWMVRKDDVDIGIWRNDDVQPQNLYAITRADITEAAVKSWIITFAPSTWKAVLELTNAYKSWNPVDPLIYDLVFLSKNVIE